MANPGRCGNRRKRAPAGGDPCGFYCGRGGQRVQVKVSAVEVNTPEEMFVENGTDAKLPCTFTSVEVISSAASVSWSFQPEGAATRISFFYYSNGKSYPGKDIPFKDRITWAGDLNKKDASITISNMQFRDNGTYICDVKNPPDIVVKPGEIRVRVVEKDLHAGFPCVVGHLHKRITMILEETLNSQSFSSSEECCNNCLQVLRKTVKAGFQAVDAMLSCIPAFT
ncbi:myelin protein zero-like protein 1 isoform X4 [Empidonax traillii]|uniref:myelin protein zero-like protein 1 isoform X4 n=1 Tax=Empidonax traillii TaxID=164674 RepID=UPI000FFD48E3|nr:myelin protein zero-like protein 1 isoform X4 [Empidonax traillii]